MSFNDFSELFMKCFLFIVIFGKDANEQQALLQNRWF